MPCYASSPLLARAMKKGLHLLPKAYRASRADYGQFVGGVRTFWRQQTLLLLDLL
jgi:hypothetical protein